MNSNLQGGSVVLDAEGLSRIITKDHYMLALLKRTRDNEVPIIVSAVTLVEVIHPRTNRSALAWTLSQLRVEPVTEALSLAAANLLQAAGKHGHTHALDAIVCATALSEQGMATIYTSDPDDIESLVTERATVVHGRRLRAERTCSLCRSQGRC